MTHNQVNVPTTAQLRTFEAAWIKACHPRWGVVLMEVAGSGACGVALEMLADDIGPVVVLCGGGNNGGDGFVVARHLQTLGVTAKLFAVKSTKQADSESEASINKKIIEKLQLPIIELEENNIAQLQGALSECNLIVDALLGTGLDRETQGIYRDAIIAINRSGKAVLSIDVPSGINSDTGQVMGVAVEADKTVTFGYLKPGLLHYPGAAHAGELRLIDIGLPSIDELPEPMKETRATISAPRIRVATYDQITEWLPPRASDGHKGSFGRVLVVAGSDGMVGSAALSARSVLRSGSGYSVLATGAELIKRFPPDELVYRPLSTTTHGSIAPPAVTELKDELELATAVVLGPGLSTHLETQDFVHQFIAALNKPCIIDADGLNALNPSIKLPHPESFVFTPHPKELSRLINKPVSEIQADRVAAAMMGVAQYGCTIVLKGARTVVATPTDGTWIIPTGNSGMATPGSGDVLSGIVGAFLGRKMKPSHAAIAAAYIHGAAGDMAAEVLGEDGIIATDILDSIPMILASLRGGDFDGCELEQQLFG